MWPTCQLAHVLLFRNLNGLLKVLISAIFPTLGDIYATGTLNYILLLWFRISKLHQNA